MEQKRRSRRHVAKASRRNERPPYLSPPTCQPLIQRRSGTSVILCPVPVCKLAAYTRYLNVTRRPDDYIAHLTCLRRGDSAAKGVHVVSRGLVTYDDGLGSVGHSCALSPAINRKARLERVVGACHTGTWRWAPQPTSTVEGQPSIWCDRKVERHGHIIYLNPYSHRQDTTEYIWSSSFQHGRVVRETERCGMGQAREREGEYLGE